MSREQTLTSIINELKIENRKFEFGSALERLTRRVVALEERLNKLEKN